MTWFHPCSPQAPHTHHLGATNPQNATVDNILFKVWIVSSKYWYRQMFAKTLVGRLGNLHPHNTPSRITWWFIRTICSTRSSQLYIGQNTTVKVLIIRNPCLYIGHNIIVHFCSIRSVWLYIMQNTIVRLLSIRSPWLYIWQNKIIHVLSIRNPWLHIMTIITTWKLDLHLNTKHHPNHNIILSTTFEEKLNVL